MKNFNLSIRNILPLGKIRQFAGAVIICVMALLLPGGVFAQKPVISYSGAQTYTTGTAITPLAPTATGVAALGYGNPVVVGSGFKRVTEVVADPAGNVYACDNRFMLNQFGGGGNVSFVNKILASDGSTVAVISDTYSIFGLAEDAAGNLYIKDGRDSVIRIPAGGGVFNSTRLGSGFFGSRGVAVDGAGNVYVADHGNDAVKKIPAGNGPVQTIWNSVLPVGIAADAAGNVFVDNDVDGSVYKISAGGGNPFLLIKGEGGLGTDAGGNLFIGGSSIRLIPAGGTTPVTISSGYSNAAGITVDPSENIYMACSINDTIVGVKKITPVGGYFISPQLPAGLTFDPNTGIISGLPAVASPATVYTITAYNTSGVSTTTVSITVNSIPEPIISYSSPQSYSAGTAITPLMPSSVGAVVSAPAFSSPSALVLSTFYAFSNPVSVAADAAGDLLVGDPGNVSVFRLAAGASATTTINGGIDKAGGVAFDAAGNIYLVDFELNLVEEFPRSGSPGTLGSGFSHPAGVAVDGAGNVYVTDQGHSAVKEILAGSGAIVSLGSGFSQPNGITVDGSGNVYVTDNANSLVKKIVPGNSTPVTIGSGFNNPKGVAVDATGNIFVADAGNNAVKEVLATDGSTINIGSGFSAPAGVTVDGSGNLYVADSGNGVVKKLNAVGGYYITPFLPAGLSINNTTGVISGTPTAVSPSTNYTVTAYTGAISGSTILTIAVAAPPVISYSSPQTYTQGMAIAPLGPANSGGAVATAGYQTTSSVQQNGGFSQAYGIAVDASGAMYLSDYLVGNITKIANGSIATWGSGFKNPAGIVFDAAGNLYVADAGNNAIMKVKAGNAGTVTIATGFNAPTGVAIDAAGNIYVADAGNNAIKKIPAGGGTPVTLGSGFSNPTGVAVDTAGNVYVADNGNNLVKEIPAIGNVMLSLGIGFNSPNAVTVDKYGNLFVADTHNNALKMMPPGGGFITIGSGFDQPRGVAVDTKGNVYDADAENRVGSGGVRSVAPTGGYFITSALPAGLSFDQTTGVISGTPTVASSPTNYNIIGYNALGGSTATMSIAVTLASPVISYSSPQTYTLGAAITTLNPSSSNVAAWSYNNTPVSLGSTTEPLDVAADAAGNVYVADIAASHVIEIPAGGGSPVFLGSFSAPLGVAVDASGNVYVANASSTAIIEVSGGSHTTTLLGSGFSAPSAVAVDAAGNVYVADSGNGALKEIPAGNGTPVTIKSGFASIQGVAVDASGNLFVADEGTSGNGAVYKIPAGGGSMVSVGSGFSKPSGVVVDAAGNLYISDLNKTVITVIEPNGTQFAIGSGFNSPNGVTVDGSGNVYIADSNNGAVKEVTINGGYFLSKLLPAGLAFDNNTGAISGTPTAASAATNYTVTAYNTSGSATATVNITTTAPPPPVISYSTPQTFVQGTAITAQSPTNTGSAVGSFGFGSPNIVTTGVADPVCMTMDKSGNMYIGESSGKVSLLPAGGSSATVFASGFGPVNNIVLDASNNVYLADGAKVWKIPAGGGTAVSLNSFYNPLGLTIDAAGNLYVGDSNIPGSFGEILEMAPDGSNKTHIAYADNPNALVFDSNGTLYFLDRGSPIALRYIGGGCDCSVIPAPNEGYLAVDATGNIYEGGSGGINWYSPGTGSFNINTVSSAGVMIDANNNLYYADGSNIYKMSPAGGYFISPQLPSGLSFNSNTGVISGTPVNASPATNYAVTAFTASGSGTATVNITVNPHLPAISYSSPQSYQVGTAVALAPSSTYVSSWGYSSNITAIGTFFHALTDVVTDAAGNKYVSEFGNGQLDKIPAGGGAPVVVASGFSGPFGLAIDAAGNLYITDSGNNLVKEIPAGTSTVNTIGSGFNGPAALAVDASGNVYVGDTGNGALKEIPAGNGTPVTLQTGFASIQGVTVDAAGNIYVADAGTGSNGAVYKVPPGGGSMVSLGTGFSRPSGIVVDAAGNLYVSDLNHAFITVIKPDNTQLSIGSGVVRANGVALDASGNLYMADTGTGFVEEVKINGGYFLSPLLPAGLTFNNSTGVISGTPAVSSPTANYAITGWNVTGGSADTVSITVGAPVISYVSPVAYATGAAITPLTPTVSGGAVASPGFNTTPTAVVTGLTDATCTAMDKNGNLYIGESSGKVSVLAPGSTAATVYATGFNSGILSGSLAADASGNVYVTDLVSLWKIPAGGGTPVKLSSFVNPSGVAVDGGGNIYVDDLDQGIYKLAPDGTNKTELFSGIAETLAADQNGNVFFSGRGSEFHLYEIPAGGTQITVNSNGARKCTTDPSGNVYVVNNDLSIGMMAANGTTEIQIEPASVIVSFSPDIRVGADFNLYITDNGSIRKAGPTGGYFTSPELPSGLTINPNTGAISGTPAAASPTTNYTVKAFNSAAAASANVNITVGPAPAISYSTPQVFTTGTTISPLLPAGTGAAVSAPAFNAPIAVSTGITDATCTALDKNGNLYIGELSGKISMLAPGSTTATVLATGFRTYSSSTFNEGIAVDASGNVYFADGSSLWKIPAGGGTPAKFSSFDAPLHVSIDAAGSLYVSDFAQGIYKMAPDGTNKTRISTVQANTMAADQNGNVFFSSRGSLDKLLEIPAGGTQITVNPNQLRACATDPSGNAYVINNDLSITVVPASGTTATQVEPAITGLTSIMIGPDLNLYAVVNGGIVKTNFSGGYFISPELPEGLTIDPTSGAISGTPTAISAAKNYTVTAFSGSVSASATLNLAVNGSLPVISYATPQVYTPGVAITPLAPSNTGAAVGAFEFNTSAATLIPGVTDAVSLAMDKSGNLYVGEGTGNISVILAGASTATVFATGFPAAWSIALDASNNVYVADAQHVWKIPAGGGTAVSLGSFHSPVGLAFDAAGKLYVADNSGATGGVFKMNSDGTGQTRIDNNLPQPAYLAFDNNGNLFIGDQIAQALYEIPAGGVQKQVASGLGVVVSVKIDPSGNVYVSGRAPNNIYCYSPASGLTSNIAPFETDGLMTDANFNLYYAFGNIYKLSPSGGYFTNPQLPSGLTIDSGTGVISGTPSVLSPATNYTVTAFSNSGGNGSAAVSIAVLSADATLASLSLSKGTLSPTFSSGVTGYTANVPYSVSSITVTATPNDPNASSVTTTVNGSPASGSAPLKVGSNTIVVTVIAQDRITTKSYTVTVNRGTSVNANLARLALPGGTLVPGFTPSVTAYHVTVENNVLTETITPTVSDPNATVTVKGTAVASGTASNPIALAMGENTVTLVVTAPNGVNKTYTVTITRVLSSDAYLSNLAIRDDDKLNADIVTLSPGFNFRTMTYTAAVPASQSSVTVKPVSIDPNAVIKINGKVVTTKTFSNLIALNTGANTITIVVTAPGGATQTYAVTVTRALSADAFLSNLVVNTAALSPAFAYNTFTYTADVPNETASVTIKANVIQAGATFTVNGNPGEAKVASDPIALAVGDNIITIVVTAPDNSTTQTYTVTVIRDPGAANTVYQPVGVEKPTESLAITEDGIKVHQGISPNGDGIEDFLQIDNISQYPDNKLSIMNRNGQLVYEAKGYDNSSKTFDGHSNKNGRMQLPGTYFYQLDYTVAGVIKHKTGFLVLKY